jgi:hypothetical protein
MKGFGLSRHLQLLRRSHNLENERRLEQPVFQAKLAGYKSVTKYCVFSPHRGMSPERGWSCWFAIFAPLLLWRKKVMPCCRRPKGKCSAKPITKATGLTCPDIGLH